MNYISFHQISFHQIFSSSMKNSHNIIYNLIKTRIKELYMIFYIMKRNMHDKEIEIHLNIRNKKKIDVIYYLFNFYIY